MKKVICITGKLRSGKSYLANELKNHFLVPIVSFGKYLVDYSERNGYKTDRQSLQNLGNEFIKSDAELFLNNVINYSEINGNDIIIIEGIRHLEIARAIRKLSETCYFIYCNTPDNIRYKRFLNNKNLTDSAESQFLFAKEDCHEVEQEIPFLQASSDYMLSVDDAEKCKLFQNLENFLSS